MENGGRKIKFGITERNDGPSSSSVQKQRKRSSPDDHQVTPIKRTKHNAVDVSAQKMMFIDDFPPEILYAIFQHVDTSDLLNCRQMNRKWNEISSEIMRQRADINLKFSFKDKDGKFMQIFRQRQELMVNICETYYIPTSKSLADLVACLKEAKQFPVTSFRFDNISNFGNADMNEFLLVWGKSVLALKVIMDNPVTSVAVLRNLLCEKMPNLKKLQIEFRRLDYTQQKEIPSSIQLFTDSDEFLLPKLEVLYVNSRYKPFRGIIEDIIKAAPKLNVFDGVSMNEKIVDNEDCFYEGYSVTAEDLGMLEKCNKLHCLKSLQICITNELIGYWAQASERMMELKLKSLTLSVDSSIVKNDQLKASASTIINQLLHSSETTIQTFTTGPLGLLTGLLIPKLNHLRKLDLCNTRNNHFTMFPPSFDFAVNFPNVKELGQIFLNDDPVDVYFSSYQPVEKMLKVEILRIVGCVKYSDKLMKMTPNAKTLFLTADGRFEWKDSASISSHCQEIYKNLTKLENFSWEISAGTGTHHELLYKLDAAITGLPEKFCKEMSMKWRNKDKLKAQMRASYQIERPSSSILDLKELKNFYVNLVMDGDAYCSLDRDFYDRYADEAGFDPDSDFYKTGFTKVSKFMAFDQMPNSKVRVHRLLC